MFVLDILTYDVTSKLLNVRYFFNKDRLKISGMNFIAREI